MAKINTQCAYCGSDISLGISDFMAIANSSDIDCSSCKNHNVRCLKARISSATVFLLTMTAVFFLPIQLLGIEEIGRLGVFILALPICLYASAIVGYQFPALVKRRSDPTKF